MKWVSAFFRQFFCSLWFLSSLFSVIGIFIWLISGKSWRKWVSESFRLFLPSQRLYWLVCFERSTLRILWCTFFNCCRWAIVVNRVVWKDRYLDGQVFSLFDSLSYAFINYFPNQLSCFLIISLLLFGLLLTENSLWRDSTWPPKPPTIYSAFRSALRSLFPETTIAVLFALLLS